MMLTEPSDACTFVIIKGVCDFTYYVIEIDYANLLC